MIQVRNGVTTAAVDIQLEDSKSTKLAAQRSLPLSAKTAMLVNLQPGRHVLKIPGKPGWQVDIQVKAKAR